MSHKRENCGFTLSAKFGLPFLVLNLSENRKINEYFTAVKNQFFKFKKLKVLYVIKSDLDILSTKSQVGFCNNTIASY